MMMHPMAQSVKNQLTKQIQAYLPTFTNINHLKDFFEGMPLLFTTIWTDQLAGKNR